jgi:hypothetical protein
VMLALMSVMACSRHAIPTVLSRHCDVRTVEVSSAGAVQKRTYRREAVTQA